MDLTEKGSAAISLESYRRMGRLLVAVILALHGYFLWTIRGGIARGDPDFTVYFTAGKMLREGRGGELYDARAQLEVQREFTRESPLRRGPLPYIHPPFEALLFVPLTFLPYRAAFVLWNAVNLGLLGWVFGRLRRWLVSLGRIAALDWMLACLAFFPVLANFHQGQDAILLLLVLVLGFGALSENADFAAGCWLGLGMFKFQFMLPMALILALWRGRKLAYGFTLVAAATVAVSIALVGWQEALEYPAYAWHIVSRVRLGGLPARLMPNLMGLVNGWPGLENVGWPLKMVALAGSAGLLIALASMTKMARDPRLANLCIACAVIAAVTISYNTNTYDLSLLVLPIALLVDYSLRAREPRRAFKALFVPALPLLISPLWFVLWLRWERNNLMAIFLLWWLYLIWKEIRRVRAGAGESGLACAPAMADSWTTKA